MYDLLGIGLGPFNLSLAALLAPKNTINMKFFDDKKSFAWHPELLFDDATMQTSFLKDLVTPVDPTNPYSFLNYLVKKNQFYSFLNTGRNNITRFEFNDYLKWVSQELNEYIEFDSMIEQVEYFDDHFKVFKHGHAIKTKHLCVASGPVKNIPKCALPFLGENVFHAKDPKIQNMSLSGKRVLIVGGGQTGLETFRNVLKDKWGHADKVKLITGRQNLLPLDEGPFTNEIFTPEFVQRFYNIDQIKKEQFTKQQLLASDGNTPSYLQEFYNELYLDKFYKKQFCKYEIAPMNWLKDISFSSQGYTVSIECKLENNTYGEEFDIIILATGFSTKVPTYLDGIRKYLELDELGRPITQKNYELKTKLNGNKIFAMNYSRHGHGIADPQTSLMSWRSSVIANSLLDSETFPENNYQNNQFINFFNDRGTYV